VVVPLEADSIGTILAAIGGALPRKIIHVQVEKAGILQFGAYDQFQPGCIVFGSTVNRRFLEALVSQGVMKTLGQV
jgi:CO dehydrogenase nickel-insertion accessory protein CooC1